jgi:hypothetical protein
VKRAYLVILDWEEDEAVWVFLQQWLIGLGRLDGRRNLWLFLFLDGIDARLLGLEVIDDGRRWVSEVLLVGRVEVDPLDRRFSHLETFESHRNLDAKNVSEDSLVGGRRTENILALKESMVRPSC